MNFERSDERFVLRKKPYEVVPIFLPYPVALVLIAYMTAEMAAGVRPVHDLPGLIVAWVVLGAIILGVAGLLTVVTLTLDRPAGTVTLRRASLLRATEQVTPLAEVRRAEVESKVDSDNDTVYRLVLRLHDGTVLPFTWSTFNWLGDKQQAADAINQFLGVESPLLPTAA